MLNQKQTDCRFGGVAFAAGEDLSLKTGYLARLNAGGDLVLPQGAGEITPYVLTQGADQGYLCGAVPLTSAGNCRIRLAGTCAAGDLLVAKGDGRVEAGALGGGALPVGMAEEKGVDGQHVLLRPLAVGTKGADGADGADGAAGANGADGMDGGAFHVPVSLIANAPSGNDLIGLILGVFAGPVFDAYPNNISAIAWVVVSGLTVIDGTTYAVCWKLWQVSPPDNTQVLVPVSVIAPGNLTTEVRAVQIPETGYCRLSRDDSAYMMGSVVLKVASVSGSKVLGFTFYSV